MPLVYQEITRNKRKTWFYLSFFVILLSAFGFGIGLMYEEPWLGLGGIFVFSLVYIAFSMAFGAKIALKATGAKPIQKKDDPRLFRIVENLSIASGIPTPEIYIIDDPALNAFATGLKPEKASVAFTRGLLNKLSDAELEGVAAHELSHIRNYDTRLALLVMMLVGIIAVIAASFKNIIWYGFRHFRGNKKDAGSALITLLCSFFLALLASFFATLIQLAISRRRESLADASAVLLTRYPKGLASALERLSEDQHTLEHANKGVAHLFLVNPFKKPWFGNLFSTHPPIEDRIKALQAMDQG